MAVTKKPHRLKLGSDPPWSGQRIGIGPRRKTSCSERHQMLLSVVIDHPCPQPQIHLHDGAHGTESNLRRASTGRRFPAPR